MIFPKYTRATQRRQTINIDKSDRVKVTLVFDIPKTATATTDANVEEYLRFHLNDNGLLNGPEDNPLSNAEPCGEPLSLTWEYWA